MKNYIAENIHYLVKKTGFFQDDFGAIFGIKKGVTRAYIIKTRTPQIETIQKICAHFDIYVDDFLYIPLEQTCSLSTVLYANKIESDIIKKQSKLIAAMEEEIAILNSQIISPRSQSYQPR